MLHTLTSSLSHYLREPLVSPDLRVLLDPVVLLVCLDREESVVSLVFPDPL